MMSYTNGKWFEFQGKIKCSPFFRWKIESIMVRRFNYKHRFISKVASPLMHWILTRCPGEWTWSLMIWSISPLLFNGRFANIHCRLVLCHWPCWPRAWEAEEASIRLLWIHLQWQMHTSSSFPLGNQKPGKLTYQLLYFLLQ